MTIFQRARAGLKRSCLFPPKVTSPENVPEKPLRFGPGQDFLGRTGKGVGSQVPPAPRGVLWKSYQLQKRRFTRLTNAFSRKDENLACAVALHFMHYNFCRVHKTLRVTPPMQAGIADHVWEIDEIIALMNSGGILALPGLPVRLRF
jgi:hypothetical protein